MAEEQQLEARASLDAEEAQFRMLAENIPGLCWLAGIDGRTYWMNGAGRRYFGKSEGGTPSIPEVVHPDDLRYVDGLWHQAMATGEPQEAVMRMLGADGHYRPFLSRATPMRNAEGEIRRWFGVQIDLTEHRAHAEADLRERERRQAFLLDWSDELRRATATDELMTITLERLGRHLGATRTTYSEADDARRVFTTCWDWCDDCPSLVGTRVSMDAIGEKLEREWLAGEIVRYDDVYADPRVSEQDRAIYDARHIRAFVSIPLIRNGRVRSILSVQSRTPRVWRTAELDLIRDMGERTWVALERARAQFELLERDRNQAFLIAWNDRVQEESGAGAILAASLEMAAAHFDAMQVTFAEACDAHEQLKVVEAWGPGASDLVGQQVDETATTAEGSSPNSARISRHGRVEAMMSVTRAGDRKWTASDQQLLRDLADRILTLVERARSEERAAAGEAALAQSREALYHSEKLTALGSLLAGVSHELNNPLSIVVAQSVMLERLANGTELAERALKIRKAAERCARIVQTFLAMARQKRPERSTASLNAIATAALELADYGLKSDGIVVETDFAADLPELQADSDQLHQVIINLIVNAQQAMRDCEGERRLKLATAVGEEPRTVVLDVADNGPGIPEDLARRIFEPFFTTKPQGEGTGVGLSFSMGLVEAHGGKLALMPSERGACFRLTLPIEPPAVLGGR